jgi:hypothetical protein
MNVPTIPKDRAQSCGQVQGQAAKATPIMGWRGVLKKASLHPITPPALPDLAEAQPNHKH